MSNQSSCRLLRAPWEEAPVGPPKLGQRDSEGSYGKVQRSAKEGPHTISGMPGGLARRPNGGHSVGGDSRQEPKIVRRGGTS